MAKPGRIHRACARRLAGVQPAVCPPVRVDLDQSQDEAVVCRSHDLNFLHYFVPGTLEENHGRAVSRCLIQDVADAVAAAVLIKQEEWSYALPKFEEPPATVAISLDGTCLHLCEDGWRETMVGTLAFYDRQGERLHTVYLGATPEYGKAKFLAHLEAEIVRAKAKCPEAHYVGIADGAKGNWDFLGRHTDVQATDFLHAAEYLGKAAVVLYRGQPQTRKAWLDDACHRLKHESGGAEWVLKRLRTLAKERPWAKGDEDVERAITYFANQSGAGRMDYAAGWRRPSRSAAG